MKNETKKITFNSVADFRSRICKLWQDQLEGESYEFIFNCKEAEKELEYILSKFKE